MENAVIYFNNYLFILFCGLLLDPKINVFFYRNVLPTFFGSWKMDYYNQSLSGFVGRSMQMKISEMF